ncbi:hypothetical protein GCM10010124_25100 [Pilimelia terevasa]|uniref:PrgI family protein n=1 Tax=Pilimelia terevasa TaxID=53372 RepID=A0A8J3BLN5_9ACTN|nr:PrgI family protein [Pilimelia terevasa]GGK31340.1 hypothetical protein GCM10010124_25100 [Pilimelia terevasa]
MDSNEPPRAKIAADVDAPDKVLYGLTFRQLAILAVGAVAFYSFYQAVGRHMPAPVLVVAGVLIGGTAFGLAVGRRDGQSLDVWLLAALRHGHAPKALTDRDPTPAVLPDWAPEAVGKPVVPAPLRLPAQTVAADGQITTDTGSTAIVATTTVNLALRTPAEQAGLVDGFGRWCNSLTTATQVVVSAQPVDIAARADHLRAAADRLPHPALAGACTDHAAFLDSLADSRDPLRRQVLVVTTSTDTAGNAARRSADDTARALTALGVTAQPLEAGAVGAALAAAVDPFRTAAPGARATTDTPITVRRSP